jgi:hypothetical protein
MQLRAVLRPSNGNMANFSKQAARSPSRRGSKRRSLTLAANTKSPSTGELPVQILTSHRAASFRGADCRAVP